MEIHVLHSDETGKYDSAGTYMPQLLLKYSRQNTKRDMDTVVKQALFNYRATKAWDRVHTSQRTNSWCFCGDWTQRSWPQAARYQEKRITSAPHIRKKRNDD